MAKNNKAEETAQNMSDYATRHPRRMWSGAFLVGTALGATLMAAKKSHDKNAVQKFLDSLGH